MRDVPAGVGLALSPDGATLAVIARNGIRNGNNPQRSVETLLFTVGVDGRNYQLLHGPFTNDTLAKVAWSRDGRTIHFCAVAVRPKGRALGMAVLVSAGQWG